ncbi:MBL fold metallo-hydrolase [Hymenobacter terrestris]|uniref:MBL fold metallo-hydrolase n=1 Tax=Hymenobacter terrestris TaxID=2748310 RepID=A0ABX2Q3Z2_9BACT|nr:MBL fold metallo-hydrolase [Hymenobacter terrestris]NVO85688.1 MBL fold metallo-hydrolase [Hymenobacter terrestris]
MASVRFVRNPDLRTIKPAYPGNKMVGNAYCNGQELYEPQLSTLLKWQLSKNPQKEEKKEDTWAPNVVDGTAFLHGQEDGLLWLGHSSFVLRVAGVTMITDPLLFSSVGLRRRHALPCQPEDLVGIDLLLLSHGHRDHLDEQSIKLLARQNPQLRAYGPLGLPKLLRGIVPRLPVQEAGWWQQFDLGPETPFELFELPASHWYRRGLLDVNEVLWGSLLLRLPDGRTIYFAGDTNMSSHFEEIERQFGPLDVVLMPIGAYKPAYMMAGSHTNPHESAKAANLLRAGHLVPMHHGTFDLSDEPASEPQRLLTEIAASGMLRAELHLPAVGEVLRWQDWE